MTTILQTGLAFAICTFLSSAGTPAKDAKPFQNTKDETEIAKLTNLERKKDGKPALVLSTSLSKIARAHSENMARQGMMKHKLDNKDVFNRLEDASIDYEYAGENIARGEKDVTLKKITKLWMDSKDHRKNILFADFTEIGIGIARAKDGTIYFTQVFAKPEKE